MMKEVEEREEERGELEQVHHALILVISSGLPQRIPNGHLSRNPQEVSIMATSTIEECLAYFPRVWHNTCNQCYPRDSHAIFTCVPRSSHMWSTQVRHKKFDSV